ncbi:MAG: hypothetical protein JO353_11895 [Phycisphaerae bacterium]|nr:hypothetical protein [Phycisphaerae bacterium]
MTCIGHAIQITDGIMLGPNFWPIVWVTLAIDAAALAIFYQPGRNIPCWPFLLVVVICLLINFIQLESKAPGIFLRASQFEHLQHFLPGVGVAAVLCGIIVMSDGIVRRCAFAGVLMTIAYLGHWTICNSPNPSIDVYVFQADSSSALKRGHNPYDMTFPDIYGPPDKVYGPGVVKNGRLQFGYPYFPETLLTIMPARLMNLDVRYSHLAALILTAVLIVAIQPELIGYCSALLLLTTPRIFFLIEQSFVEPFVILAFTATVFCSVRLPRALPIAMGSFLASKQYVPMVAILVFLWPRPWRENLRLLIGAMIVAALVTLPLALWNFRAFWQSTITLQFHQPFRWDSISYLALIGEAHIPKPAQVAIPFGIFFAAIHLVLWLRKSLTFSAAIAFCFLLFFAFNKQAFGNYYLFVMSALACAIVEPHRNPGYPSGASNWRAVP